MHYRGAERANERTVVASSAAAAGEGAQPAQPHDALGARALRPAVRTANIRYAVRDIVVLAEEVRRTGKSMLYLNIGDPNSFDFAPPEAVVEAVCRAMRDNRNGYTASSGLPQAVEALRADADRRGLRPVQHIFISNGTSEAIELALSALVNRGENILTPTPGYPLYTAVLAKLEAENRPYFLDEERGWAPCVDDIAAKIDAHTRAIVLVNPNNPTGASYSRDALERIVALAVRHNLVILSDEIYDQLVFDGEEHVSTAAISAEAKVVTFNGLSKAYCCPGFRLGWGIVSGPAAEVAEYCEAIRKMERIRLCANHPEQYAIEPALATPAVYHDALRAKLTRRRDITFERLNAMSGISCVRPGGAFYAFPRIDLDVSDDEFVAELIRQAGVVLVPGSGFGQRPGTRHFRVVFLPPEEQLERAFGHVRELAERWK